MYQGRTFPIEGGRILPHLICIPSRGGTSEYGKFKAPRQLALLDPRFHVDKAKDFSGIFSGIFSETVRIDLTYGRFEIRVFIFSFFSKVRANCLASCRVWNCPTRTRWISPFAAAVPVA